jgi:hypothetical protein
MTQHRQETNQRPPNIPQEQWRNNIRGPAFPCHPGIENPLYDGMSLRDYFAAKASEEDIKFWLPMGVLVEVVKETGNGKIICHQPGMFTREQARYRYADAMLKARLT